MRHLELIRLSFVLLSIVAIATSAFAQDGQIKVAILRSTTGDAGELAERTDTVLLHSLSELAGIQNPTVSPIDYAEIRLTVGCQDQSKACLASIAKLLEVDAVLVRRLDTSVPQKVTLALLYFDVASTDEPPEAEVVGQGPDAGQTAIDGVDSAVRSLFGIPEAVHIPPVAELSRSEVDAPVKQAVPTPAPSDRTPTSGSSIGVVTWATLIGGGLIVGAGLLMALSASDAYDDYKEMPIRSQSDIDRADDELDKARFRGTAANILIPTGSLLIAVGGMLLYLDLTKSGGAEKSSARSTRLAFQPLGYGGLFVLDGLWAEPW